MKKTITFKQLKRLVKEGTDGYLSFDDLSHDQIVELKQRMLTDRLDKDGESPSYGELADADELISDEEVRKEFDGTAFSPEDFSCEAVQVTEDEEEEGDGEKDGEEDSGEYYETKTKVYTVVQLMKALREIASKTPKKGSAKVRLQDWEWNFENIHTINVFNDESGDVVIGFDPHESY